MAKRVKVPAEAVRTREQILDGMLVRNGHVWLTCWNCGGTTTYPSSMEPPGRCRLMCWARPSSDPMAFPGTVVEKPANDPTRGKLAYDVERYVKREQASDRKAYRFELERPERERIAADRAAVLRAEQEAREAEEAAKREAVLAAKRAHRHLGEIGQRIQIVVCVDAVVRFDGYMPGQSRYLVRFRDNADNALVWWTASPGPLERGDQLEIAATVKAHEEYRDEPQTVLLRVKPTTQPAESR